MRDINNGYMVKLPNYSHHLKMRVLIHETFCRKSGALVGYVGLGQLP